MRPLMIAAILITQISASGQDAHLQPRVVLPGEAVGGAFWLQAPDVVIVKVASARWIGPEIALAPGKIVVRLVGVNAVVENVLRGDLRDGPIRFYFFTNTLTRTTGYTTVRLWFQPGERYAVFLRGDAGVLRTMADLTEPTIRIPSGSHETPPLPPTGSTGWDLGAVIASTALTPSADPAKGFAGSIQDTFDRLLLITTPAVLSRLLRSLLVNNDPEIRDSACIAVSINFSYQDPCLAALVESGGPTERQKAAAWFARKQAGEQMLVTALKENPLSLSTSGRVEDIATDLELFTFDRSESVRLQACLALGRIFPSRDFRTCASLTPSGRKD